MRSKRQEIARAINAKSDRQELEAVNSTPLGLDQNSIQHDLRREFSRVQKLLAEAEEGITMLRVTLASRGISTGKTHSLKKPTVEAVTNTIKKMTSMIERKTLDIDVLEVKMGRLGLFPGSIEGNRETSVPLSPFSKKSPIVRDGGTGRHSFTPERSNGASLRGTNPGSPRKGMDNVTNEEVERYKAKVQQRRAVGAIFKKLFLDGGPRVRPLES
jgi:nucleoporin NUP159